MSQQIEYTDKGIPQEVLEEYYSEHPDFLVAQMNDSLIEKLDDNMTIEKVVRKFEQTELSEAVAELAALLSEK